MNYAVVEDERILPSAQQCTYTNCYCEENVWKMCEYVRSNSPEELSSCVVVFISNIQQMIPLWCQKTATSKDEPVIWDYHVIFVHSSRTSTRVYDLDTILEFPCSFELYSSNTFKSDEDLKPEFHRLFRVILASVFLSTFASDRSRMKGRNGEWIKEPPNYPCIRTKDDCNNLATFINMERGEGVGQVVTLDELRRMFNPQPPS